VINGAHVILSSKDADADRGFLRDILGFPRVAYLRPAPKRKPPSTRQAIACTSFFPCAMTSRLKLPRLRIKALPASEA
jgi:hypothetical protein